MLGQQDVHAPNRAQHWSYVNNIIIKFSQMGDHILRPFRSHSKCLGTTTRSWTHSSASSESGPISPWASWSPKVELKLICTRSEAYLTWRIPRTTLSHFLIGELGGGWVERSLHFLRLLKGSHQRRNRPREIHILGWELSRSLQGPKDYLIGLYYCQASSQARTFSAAWPSQRQKLAPYSWERMRPSTPHIFYQWCLQGCNTEI